MSGHRKGKRRDEEVFSGNEFYRCDEFRMNKAERFLVSEGTIKPERFETTEENTGKQTKTLPDQKETVAEEIKAKAKKINTTKFHDRVIESTGPIRTIVSAATCTVAVATATTTVFLASAPQTENVVLVTGNDYVKYELNLSFLDKDSSYQLIVTNASFSHTEEIDATKTEALEYLNGYVYGLKPNRKYDFRLMRHNGEIGGYSEFYTKSFFTQKAPDPTALFDFSLDEDVLHYEIQLSDYYQVCEDTYLEMETNGDVSDRIPIDSESYSSTLTNVDDSDILFRLYSTIDGEEKLLSEYTYVFNDISVEISDDGVFINGHVGDEFKTLSSCEMEFTADYLYGDSKTEKKTIEQVTDIQESLSLPTDFISYRLCLKAKDYLIYDSGEVLVDDSPTYSFTTQELTYSELKILSEGITSASTGSIMTSDGKEIPLGIHDGYILIPLRDSLGNRYSYSSYTFRIDGKSYEIEPDTTLLYVDEPELYFFNETYFLHSFGYTTLNKETDSLAVDVGFGSEVKETVYASGQEQMIALDTVADSPNYFTVSYYPVDSLKESLGQGDTFQNLALSDSIEFSLNVNDGTLQLSLYSQEDYEVEIHYYDSDGGLLKSFIPEWMVTDNGKFYGEALTDDVSSVTYDIKKDGKSLFKSESLETINLTLVEQVLDHQNLVLTVEGAKAGMEGTIQDKDGEDHPLTIEDSKIIIPLYNDYGVHYEYESYDLKVTNQFDTVTFTPEIETDLQIEDVMLAETTNDNGVFFKAYYVLAEGVTDYQAMVDAYQGSSADPVTDTVSSEFLPTVDNNALSGYNTDETKAEDTRLVFRMTDSYGNALTTEETFTITSECKTMTDTSGSFDGSSAGDVLETYHDDGTINFYIPFTFSNTDPDVFVRVYVGDEYYDTTSQVLEVKNLSRDKTYALRFRLLKSVDGSSPFCYEELLSGTLNEEGYYSFSVSTSTENDGKKYAEVDVSDYANAAFDPTKCSFEGHPDFTYDETTHTFKVEIGEDETILTMHFHGSSHIRYDDYDALQDILDNISSKDSSIQIQGNLGHEVVLSLSLN